MLTQICSHLQSTRWVVVLISGCLSLILVHQGFLMHFSKSYLPFLQSTILITNLTIGPSQGMSFMPFFGDGTPDTHTRDTHTNEVGKNKASLSKKGPYLALHWSLVYDKKFDKPGSVKFTPCDVKNCQLTTDRSQLAESDAILFHMWDLARHTEKDLPKQRWPHQRWVLYGHESAVNANFSLYYDEEFNTTITYKNDADVHYGYGSYAKHDNSDYVLNHWQNVNRAENKTRLVAWVISHCGAPSLRDDYIRELGKYVTVDGYGSCAGRKCTETEVSKKDPKSRIECSNMLAATYKFYLSFENSLCDGYATEKVWARLRTDVVPIVLGASDYSKILPPNSFIDVRNFSSPKALATYLKKIDNDDNLYNSFFEWKKYYRILSENPFCGLCSFLHTNNERKVYTDIGKWWDTCKSADDFYKNVADKLR